VTRIQSKSSWRLLDAFSAQYPVQAELVKLPYFAGMTNEEASQVLGISRAPGCSSKSAANKSVLKSYTFPPGFSFTSMKTSAIWNPNRNKYEPRPVSRCAESGGPTGDGIPG
jgi:hypothetical protein